MIVTSICKACGQIFSDDKPREFCQLCTDNKLGLRVSASVIPHKFQRYDTAGDYVDTGNGASREIFVSYMGNRDYEFLVMLHELIEQHLCLKRGIPEPVIAAFDMAYEGDDPGSDPDAPYHKEHEFSNIIESIVAKELGINIEEYEKALAALEY